MKNEIKEKFLPIGTVVKLIGGKAVLMITGYCPQTTGKIKGLKGEIENTKDTYFDYAAVAYPAGIIDSNINVVFNHENIETVLFMGFETEIQEEYSKFLKEEMKKLDEATKKKEENK